MFIERQPRLIRPINYPPGTPGKGSGIFKAANGADVLVINAMGLIFMPELADPFRAIDAEIEACRLKQGADAIVIDFHAEATSEKQALGYFVDGRASCVVGTHTHAPTADERVLPGGTAFISDIGMCGDYQSVLGMVKERADQPVPHQDPARAAWSRPWALPRSRGWRSRSTMPPALPCAPQGCGSVVCWHLPSRCSGSSEREIEKTAYSVLLQVVRADTRGSRDCRRGQQGG